jgi:hypothetical protein
MRNYLPRGYELVAIAKASAWSKFKAEVSNRGGAESMTQNDIFDYYGSLRKRNEPCSGCVPVRDAAQTVAGPI